MSRSIAVPRAGPGSPGAVRAVPVDSTGAGRSPVNMLTASTTRQPPCGCRQLIPETMMAAFENTVTITRPVEEVFTYLADAENLPQWNYAIEQTRKILPGPGGRRHRLPADPDAPRQEPGGFRDRSALQPPGQLALDGTFGPFKARASYLLEPAASGTTLTNKWDLQPTSAPLRLLGPLAIPKVKSAVAENLRTLKQILENVRG